MKTMRPREARSRGSTACVTATCPTDVDLQCGGAVLQGNALDRAADDDPGVVDHRVQPRGQRIGQRSEVLGVGDVEHDGRDPPRVGR